MERRSEEPYSEDGAHLGLCEERLSISTYKNAVHTVRGENRPHLSLLNHSLKEARTAETKMSIFCILVLADNMSGAKQNRLTE